MKNFEFEHNGIKLWYSRSVAVIGIVYSCVTKNTYVLATKRGTGCPDEVGKWVMPCGYVDFDESVEEAVSREVLEETGILIPYEAYCLIGIDSDPYKDKRQNITIRYSACVEDMNSYKLSPRFSEENEVDDIKWINIIDVDRYEWGFGHKKIIDEFFGGLKNVFINKELKDVEFRGKYLKLTKTEFRVFEYIYESGTICSRENICKNIYKCDYYYGDCRNIDATVSRIRKKFKYPGIIKSRTGHGYYC